MAPADSTDWLFAALALTTVATSTASAAEGPQAGVVTGASETTRAVAGTPANTTGVVLGDTVRAGEEFRTGSEGIIHILFLDQSSITLGPDSVLVLDSFTHDEASRTGKIAMTLHAGSVRVVGGANSKVNETEVRTPGATVGILGGISVVETGGQGTSATFLFGQSMRVTNSDGQSQTVLRPGFSVSASTGQMGNPVRTPAQQLSSLTGRFEAGGPTGGSANASPSAPQSSSPSLPSSPLISTSDRPVGQNSPANALAPDRLTSPTSSLVGSAMSRNRPDAVSPLDAPPPVTTVRTLPPTVTS